MAGVAGGGFALELWQEYWSRACRVLCSPVIGTLRQRGEYARMSERVPATNFSASWVRVDQTSDPSFYASLLDATRAQGLDQARRDPGTAFGPLELRTGLRVLDVGCGTGGYLRILAPLVAPGPAVGIDLSATLIAQAQQRTAAGEANVLFRVGNAYDLPFPDASFDRVVATQILLHLADPVASRHRDAPGPGTRRADFGRGMGLG